MKDRQILYKPPTQIETGKKDDCIQRIDTTKKPPVEPLKKDKVLNIPDEGKKIAGWLNEAALINRSALCKEAKIDRGNFDKYLKIGEIPEKLIENIKKVISKYGYI